MSDLITAKVFKQRDTPLGIVFKEDKNGNTVIKEIDYNGLLGLSGFEPGMKIVSINGISCEALSKKFIVEIIRKAEGTLTLVAGKITTKVETFTVIKKSKDEKIGISLVNYEFDPGAVFIKTVKENGKLAGAGIRPGMKVISINGVPIKGYDCREAILLLSEAEGEISIVTEDCASSIKKKDQQAETKEFTVTKASKDEKIGLGLKSSESTPGEIIVSTVKEGGKFAETSIHPGMVVLSVNGVDVKGYSVQDAILLFSEAVGEVTVQVKDSPPPSTKKAVQQSYELVDTSQVAAVVPAQPMPVVAASPYMYSPIVAATSIPPPPGVKAGGIWGSSKYIGEKTFAICCVTVLIGGLLGAFVLCCPMDKRDTYSVDGKVYDASGKLLGFLKNGYPFKAKMPGFR